MKFLGKIIFFLIGVFVIYIILVFVSPNFANKVGKPLGLEGFNNKILELKGNLDKGSTIDFGVKELEETYNKTISGALEIKDKTVDTINGVKSTIDDVRSGVDSSIKTYEDLKGQLEGVTESIDKTAKQIQEVKGNIDKVKENFGSTGSTN